MRSLLKRLLGNRQEPEVFADYATDDWSPVPVSAAAQAPNVVGWLTEPSLFLPSRRAEQSTGRPRRETIRRMYNRLVGYMDHLSPEERAIVEEQQQKAEQQPPALKATSTVGAAVRGFHKAVASPPAVSSPLRSQHKPVDEKWLKVVETYGAHLTDEELKIIYRQLA